MISPEVRELASLLGEMVFAAAQKPKMPVEAAIDGEVGMRICPDVTFSNESC